MEGLSECVTPTDFQWPRFFTKDTIKWGQASPGGYSLISSSTSGTDGYYQAWRSLWNNDHPPRPTDKSVLTGEKERLLLGCRQWGVKICLPARQCFFLSASCPPTHLPNETLQWLTANFTLRNKYREINAKIILENKKERRKKNKQWMHRESDRERERLGVKKSFYSKQNILHKHMCLV